MNNWEALVEATIEAIRVDSVAKEVHVILRMASADKKAMQIIATGVDEFLISEMRLSNVVDRVHQISAEDIAEHQHAASRIFELMRGRRPDSGDLAWQPMQERLAQIRAGTLCLVEVEPVHGASISILAKEVRLSEIN